MPVSTRHADPGEEQDLEHLDDVARRGGVERIALIHDAVAGGRCLIAEDGQVIGYAVLTPRHFFDRDFLELVVVHEDHRRRGVGRALLAAVIEAANTPRVFSSTIESNIAMRSLFTSEGWVCSGQFDGLDDNDPEVVNFIDK